MDPYTTILNESTTQTPWVPVSGWMRNQVDPACVFRLLERTVTYRWSTVAHTWEPRDPGCPQGWTDRGTYCEGYVYLLSHGGWVLVQRHKEPRWVDVAGQPVEHSETWTEHRFQTWRLPILDELVEANRLSTRLVPARAFRGDTFMPPPGATVRALSIDGQPADIRDEYPVADYADGAHTVAMTIDVDGVVAQLELVVSVVSRIRFGQPSWSTPAEDAASVVVPLRNRTSGDVVVRVGASGVPAGWLVGAAGDGVVRLAARSVTTVELRAVRLSGPAIVAEQADDEVTPSSAGHDGGAGGMEDPGGLPYEHLAYGTDHEGDVDGGDCTFLCTATVIADDADGASASVKLPPAGGPMMAS
jgi:hypothetical protein